MHTCHTHTQERNHKVRQSSYKAERNRRTTQGEAKPHRAPAQHTNCGRGARCAIQKVDPVAMVKLDLPSWSQNKPVVLPSCRAVPSGRSQVSGDIGWVPPWAGTYCLRTSQRTRYNHSHLAWSQPATATGRSQMQEKGGGRDADMLTSSGVKRLSSGSEV